MSRPRRSTGIDAVVREFRDYTAESCGVVGQAAPKLMAELKALGVDEHDAQEVTAAIDEEMGKILKELAANLRLPPKAELGSEPEEGVEYRINNDMSWVRKAWVEALALPTRG